MKKAMKPTAAAVLLITAADSVTKPTWTKAKLFGLDAKRLAAILELRYEEMGLSESTRFWRSDESS